MALKSRKKSTNSILAASIILNILFTFNAYADHDYSPEWPWKLDDSNPLKTLTINGLNLSVLQGFPTFNNGEETVKGSAQYGQKSSFFAGIKLWKGATFYANPEMWYGYNPSNNIGVASSVNIATARVESSTPYLQLQRLFFRQVIDLGGSGTGQQLTGGRSIALQNIQNKLSETKSDNNLTITIGKFGVGDIFDDNIYSHDPTKHFMNLSFNALNSVDYAGNAWGTSIGGTVEWERNWWTLRAGLFQGSDLPPSYNLEPIPLAQYMLIGEAEARYDLFENPGVIRLLGYSDYGYLNQLGEYNGSATFLDYLPYFVKNRLKKQTKLGLGLNIQQQLTDGIGLFIRAGWDNKTFDLFDITQSLNGGIVASGKLWNRPKDEFGIALGIQSMGGGISYKDFEFAPIGMGSVNFAAEKNFETYYKIFLNDNVEFTLDYQFVKNPNFLKNSDAAHVFGIRVRTNF